MDVAMDPDTILGRFRELCVGDEGESGGDVHGDFGFGGEADTLRGCAGGGGEAHSQERM